MQVQGFQPSMIVLDSNSERDLEINTTIYDTNGRELDLKIGTSC
jgi:hypothetical protein